MPVSPFPARNPATTSLYERGGEPHTIQYFSFSTHTEAFQANTRRYHLLAARHTYPFTSSLSLIRLHPTTSHTRLCFRGNACQQTIKPARENSLTSSCRQHCDSCRGEVQGGAASPALHGKQPVGILGRKGVLGTLTTEKFPPLWHACPRLLGHFVRIWHDTPEMPQVLVLSAEPFNASHKQDEAPP